MKCSLINAYTEFCSVNQKKLKEKIHKELGLISHSLYLCTIELRIMSTLSFLLTGKSLKSSNHMIWNPWLLRYITRGNGTLTIIWEHVVNNIIVLETFTNYVLHTHKYYFIVNVTFAFQVCTYPAAMPQC